mgnify:CR=1 FL=1
MITQKRSNEIWVSDLLKSRFSRVHFELETICIKHNIGFKTISNTLDIWCRDYMPIQLDKNNYLQFTYKPDYLKDFPELITTDYWCDAFKGKNVKKSSLLVDGGNVIYFKDIAVLTEKIYEENDTLSPYEIVEQIKQELGVHQIGRAHV